MLIHLGRLLAAGLILAFSLLGQTSKPGTIEGIVRDAAGAPIQGAKVHATLHGVAMAMMVRYVSTDASGSFSINRLEYGTYDVSAEKKEDDYPPSDFSFYSDKPPQTVSVSFQHPVQSVILILGPKAAVIYGVVRDAQTGKPIPPAFAMKHTEDPRRSLTSSVGPRFRILIPPSTDIDLEVSSLGYQNWIYTNPGDHSPHLSMSAGEEMKLEIALHPSFDSHRTARFLVPDGYRGWLTLKCHGSDTLTQPDESTFTFSADGLSSTTLPCPTLGPQNEYFYLSNDGSLRAISTDYWTGNGKVWGEHQGFGAGALSEFGFFVGTEKEYAQVSRR